MRQFLPGTKPFFGQIYKAVWGVGHVAALCQLAQGVGHRGAGNSGGIGNVAGPTGPGGKFLPENNGEIIFQRWRKLLFVFGHLGRLLDIPLSNIL